MVNNRISMDLVALPYNLTPFKKLKPSQIKLYKSKLHMGTQK